VIHRPAGTSLELEVTWSASAPRFRDAALSAGGCGGGNPIPTTPATTLEHWYTDPADNASTRVASYRLDASALAGCYTFAVDGYTRASNPAGNNAGPIADWWIDDSVVYGHSGVAVSVVDV
jgi:hypothetical protein